MIWVSLSIGLMLAALAVMEHDQAQSYGHAIEITGLKPADVEAIKAEVAYWARRRDVELAESLYAVKGQR